MIHLQPLPGSPRSTHSRGEVTARALRDTQTLLDNNIDGLLVENYGDLPFHGGAVGPETVAAMTAITTRIVDLAAETRTPVGVNVLRCDPAAALAVALASGARFIRINIHTGARLTDQGVLTGQAHQTLRNRSAWGANEIELWADVAVKHSLPLSPAEDLVEGARETRERGLADRLIVTGPATGTPADLEEIRQISDAVDCPVLLGSGLTPDNAKIFLAHTAGAIVGTAIKRNGRTEDPVDPKRLRSLMQAVRVADNP